MADVGSSSGDPDRRPDPPLAPWLTPAGITSLLAVVGLVTYIVLNTAAVIFYAPLGVTPREVGLGYSELLAQSVVGLGLALAFGAGIAAAVGLYMTGVTAVPGLFQRGGAARVAAAVALGATVIFTVPALTSEQSDSTLS